MFLKMNRKVVKFVHNNLLYNKYLQLKIANIEKMKA